MNRTALIFPTALIALLPSHATAKDRDAVVSATCRNTLVDDSRNVPVTGQSATAEGGQVATLNRVQLDISSGPQSGTWKIDSASHVICTITLAGNYKFSADRQTYNYPTDGTSNNAGNSPYYKSLIEGQVRACIMRVNATKLTYEFYGTGGEVGNVTPIMTVYFHQASAGDPSGGPTAQTQLPSSCPAGVPAPANAGSQPRSDRSTGGEGKYNPGRPGN